MSQEERCHKFFISGYAEYQCTREYSHGGSHTTKGEKMCDGRLIEFVVSWWPSEQAEPRKS